MDDIAFKSNWRDRESITVWLSPSDKALYKLLRDEYDVRVSEEMRKIISRGLNSLKETVIKRSAG